MSQHGRLHQDSFSSTKQHPHDAVADKGSETASVRIAFFLLVHDSGSAMPRVTCALGPCEAEPSQQKECKVDSMQAHVCCRIPGRMGTCQRL